MKKRIISLILVVVMAALALTGCAYSYTKDDMSSYAKFDEEKFNAALLELAIEDSDFGVNEGVRLDKVADAIFASLASKADTEDKKTEGVPDKYSIFYYCYYCTMTDKDGNEVILFASNMKESGATKLQLGMSTLEGLNKDIADAVKDLDIKNYTYTTETDGEVEAGDVVFISYVKEFEQKVLDKDGNPEKDEQGEDKVEAKKITVTNQMVTVGDGSGETFLDKLIGLEIGSSEGKKFEDVIEEIDGEEKPVTYSSVKVNWEVKDMVEVGTFKDTPYTDKKEVTDIFGEKHDLKDVELTYHVFPVYFIKVTSELSAEVVINDLLGDSITVDTLECFKDEKYKKGDESLEKIIEKLAELQTELTTAKDATEDAEEALEKAKKTLETAGDKATNAQKTAVSDAEKKLNEAKEKEATAQKAVDDQVKKIWECGTDIKDVIVEQYEQYRYDALEKTYKNELKQKLATEIFAIAKKYITFERDEKGWWILPEKAVKDAYARLVNNYKYDFYEGNYTSSSSSSSSSTVTNYAKYEGDFDAFLKAELGLKTTATEQQINDAIGKKAEDSVKELVIVYTLAELYGDDVAVTDEDKDEFKKSFQYILLVYQVGEDNVHESDFIHAIQLDNILNHLLEEEEKEELGEDEVRDEAYNTVKYKRVKYSFESKEPEEK